MFFLMMFIRKIIWLNVSVLQYFVEKDKTRMEVILKKRVIMSMMKRMILTVINFGPHFTFLYCLLFSFMHDVSFVVICYCTK